MRKNLLLILAGVTCLSLGTWGVRREIKISEKVMNTIPARVYEINNELIEMRKESMLKEETPEEIEQYMTNHKRLVKEIQQIYDSDPNIPKAVSYLNNDSKNATMGWGMVWGVGFLASIKGSYRAYRNRKEKRKTNDPYDVLHLKG